MTRKTSLAVLCLVGGSACVEGNRVDHASSFTGSWSLSTTALVVARPGTAPPPSSATLGPSLISSTDFGSVSIPGTAVCPGGEPIPMEAQGPRSLVSQGFACAPLVEPGCTEPSSTEVTGGTGTLLEQSLVVALTGSYRGCRGSYAFSAVIVGTRP